MPFNHLETSLEDKNILPYLGVFDGLQEPTKTVFGYTLDIGSYLQSRRLSSDYTIFGGYAVLSNLMDAFGDSVSQIWRGSSDIDMAGTFEVWKAIRQGYEISSDLASPNIKNKRTIKLDLKGEKECKIDFYLGEDTKYGESEMNTHFGMPLRVLRPEYIIREKLKTAKGEIQHYGDILAMISVMEKEGYSPKDITSVLNHDQSKELKKRIDFAEKAFSKDRLGFFPGAKFMHSLKRELHLNRSL